MRMPRAVSGTVPSAAAFNALATEVDNLGISCEVRRTSSLASPANTDLVVPWQEAVIDTLAFSEQPMWDPAFPTFLTIHVDGTYTMTLQQRWPATGGSAVGQRACKIMLNGTSVFANSIASDKLAGSTTGEGITLSTTRPYRLLVGDLIYCNYWSSHVTVPATTPTITALATDYGGTFLSVSRMGPLAL
jgi:hypothetical protein